MCLVAYQLAITKTGRSAGVINRVVTEIKDVPWT